MKPLNFPKEERLKSRKAIERLFEEGSKSKHFPILLVYRFTDSDERKVMFSVSTRNFKKAVDRNRIKRQMREIYRLHRKEWFLNDHRGIHCCFIYLSNRIPEYKQLEMKIREAVERSDINYRTTET
jgi:ribonuclease P protein component